MLSLYKFNINYIFLHIFIENNGYSYQYDLQYAGSISNFTVISFHLTPRSFASLLLYWEIFLQIVTAAHFIGFLKFDGATFKNLKNIYDHIG